VIVLRSDQWPGPLDHTVTMAAVEGAPSCCQCLAPLNSGVLVVSEWPSLDVAVTLPGVGLAQLRWCRSSVCGGESTAVQPILAEGPAF
jgi:hypothetical protein